ncbi:DUF6511 domain-containing protein [Rhizobium sp. RCAM05973]|uniref:DUF6511 domain-containing protein n=1 Tax=Rhizobium sp. RCAM05973 TaxID=2994066 RepID=UPI0022EC0855|nr:DUF6511 domain-containing protein [Rhizobium sp. RCAM05973]
MTFTPTHVDDTPAVCRCCGRHARGIGVGINKDPGYLCGECVLLVEEIKRIRRMDPYELAARAGGMDAAASLVEEFGPDLSTWEEEQVLIFCGAVWQGCADRLRELIRKGDIPF